MHMHDTYILGISGKLYHLPSPVINNNTLSKVFSGAYVWHKKTFDLAVFNGLPVFSVINFRFP